MTQYLERGLPRPVFASVHDYSERFMDALYWTPYVQAVFQHHGLPCGRVHSGRAGTFPTFLVGDAYVIKLFGEMFGGEHCHAVEMEVYRLLGAENGVPAPHLVMHGALFPPDDGWPWPYVVGTRLSGTSLGEVYDEIPQADRLELAATLGAWVGRLHAVSLAGANMLHPTWADFVRHLQARYAQCIGDHRRWGSLPEHLVDEIESYLLPLDRLLDAARTPRLLHADITADPVLGEWHRGHWCITGLIDFGDARVGHPLYELTALHLDAFRCDKGMLRAFCEAYGLDAYARADFSQVAMCYALLFPFDAFAGPRRWAGKEYGHADLQTLARALWDTDAPDLCSTGLGGLGASALA